MSQTRYMVLTDEQIAQTVVIQLRNLGMHTERVEDLLGKETPDLEILDYAHKHGYTLLTHDKHIEEHIKRIM